MKPIDPAEEQYIKDLQDAGIIKAEKEEPIAPEPAAVAAPEPVAAAPAPAPVPAPAQTEPFDGFNNLPEPTRNAILEKWKEADDAKKRAEESDRNFKQLHGKAAPVQAQLAKLQTDYAKAQNELKKYQTSRTQAQSDDAKRKLDEYRKQFPDEAAMLDSVLSESDSQISALRAELDEIKKDAVTSRQRQYIAEQIGALAQVHPDWKEKRSSDDFKVWMDNLDPYDKQVVTPLLGSTRSEDAIYVLNRFERDQLWAKSLAQNGSSPAQQAASAPPLALPDVDPDPTKRASLPASTEPSRNESDAERDFAAIVQAHWKPMKENRRRAS